MSKTSITLHRYLFDDPLFINPCNFCPREALKALPCGSALELTYAQVLTSLELSAQA